MDDQLPRGAKVTATIIDTTEATTAETRTEQAAIVARESNILEGGEGGGGQRWRQACFAALRLDSRHARQPSITIGRTERMMMARITSLKFFCTKGWLPNRNPA